MTGFPIKQSPVYMIAKKKNKSSPQPRKNNKKKKNHRSYPLKQKVRWKRLISSTSRWKLFNTLKTRYKVPASENLGEKKTKSRAGGTQKNSKFML